MAPPSIEQKVGGTIVVSDMRHFVIVLFSLSTDTDVKLKRYPASAEGMIASWVDRFPDTSVDDILDGLAAADAVHFEQLKELSVDKS